MESYDAIKIFRENIEFINKYEKMVPIIISAFGVDLANISPIQLNAAFKHKKYFKYIMEMTKIYSELEFIPMSNDNIIYIYPLRIWISPENPAILSSATLFNQPKDLYMTQIIFEHKERKIMFMCRSDEKMVVSMSTYIRNTLHMDVKVENQEIGEISKIFLDKFANDIEYKSIINNIKNYMSKINLKFGSTISLEEPKMGKLGIYYERPIISIQEHIRSPNITFYGPVTIVQGNYTSIQKYKKSEKDDSTIMQWIENNPPIDQSKSEYFKKFLDAKICKIGMNQLSSIMFSIGYVTDRSFQPPRWKL